MKDIKATHYMRRNSEPKAVIYTRGETAIEQKLFCYLYAVENNIEVLFTTNDFDKVINCEDCNMVLTVNASRISRDSFTYHKVVNALKEKGAEVVHTATEENTERFIDFVTRDVRRKREKKNK